MFFLPILASFLSLIFAIFLIGQIKKAEPGSEKMEEIAKFIREGALSYLKRQYQTIALVALFLFFLIWLSLGFLTAFSFLIGALASGISGLIGMLLSTTSNVKVAQAAKKGLAQALNLAFFGGSVTGFLVVGLGLLSISLFYFFTQDLKSLIALGFGGSLISVFARLGGGIYTKGADIGADLVGKIEKGIPEDDPRNPAVIADQVGDNVGDCAGMAADLFETYVVTIVAAMVLANLLFPGLPEGIFLPLILSSLAIVASILSVFLVKVFQKGSIISILSRGLIGAGILSAVGFLPIILNLSKSFPISWLNLYLSCLLGLLIALILFLITDFFTSKKHSPVKSLALASQSGPATNIITGIALGMKSTILPVLLISAGVLVSFKLAGIYGLALTVLSMLSLAGLIVALDSYGPITDNAAGISEMAGLESQVREVTDSLDAVGNTTKALTKSYAIASAGLAALVLFSAYTQELMGLGKKIEFLLEDPEILIGLFFGGLISYYFSALSLEAVGKAAGQIIQEVRRQFREIEGLMEGKTKPYYGKCVDIVTKAALKEMIKPALLPVLIPILVGLIFGAKALGGLLIGSIIVGLFLAISMSFGGAAWDNAKKYIEEGNLGGKGSPSHQAAVIGDTVGDPYKDTAGPAINPMIKVINIVALLIVEFL